MWAGRFWWNLKDSGAGAHDLRGGQKPTPKIPNQYNMLLLFIKDKQQVVCLVWVDGGEGQGS